MGRKTGLSKIEKVFIFRGMVDVILKDESSFLNTYQRKVVVAAILVIVPKGKKPPSTESLKKTIKQRLDTRLLLSPNIDEVIWDPETLGVNEIETFKQVDLGDIPTTRFGRNFIEVALIARRK